MERDYSQPTIETTETPRGALWAVIVPGRYDYAGELVRGGHLEALAIARAHAAHEFPGDAFEHVELSSPARIPR